MLLYRLTIYIMKTHPNKLMPEMKSLCAELRPEDGRSPVALKKAELRQQSAEHPPSQARARQYCKAVHRALEAGLSSVCGDDRLKDLTIQLVEPLHTGSNLLVIVAVPPIAPQSMLELERTLQKAAGLLRSVIATEIQRKRTPHLTFRVVPTGTGYYHGKGATPAWPDEQGRPQLGLIPMHMAAPILLVLGCDNEEFLGFAPHGAGRNVSRRAATKPWRGEDGSIDSKVLSRLVAEQTPGLDIRWWHGKPDLSETPLAYKSAAQVKAQIQQFKLADIVAEIQPPGCLMAGDGGPRPWARDVELTPRQNRQMGHRADRRQQHQSLTNWDDGDGAVSSSQRGSSRFRRDQP